MTVSPLSFLASVRSRGTLLPEGAGVIFWGAVAIIISTVTLAAGFAAQSFWVGAATYVGLWAAAIGAAALAVRHG